MEKIQESRNPRQPQPTNPNPLLWDCGSSLYDSFELKSLERQLYSAIHSKTLSMPRLPGRRAAAAAAAVPNPQPPLIPLPPPTAVSKKPSKISRSLHKLFKFVFRFKQNSRPGHEYYVVYDKSGALSTIPEVPEIEFGGFSPDINSLVRRSGSERFTATSMMGISCV
ncbi:uncharacterized protein LOC110621525 [Manihot esculenta]|uniref:Uncharacterized protein n=1 Tax=Manihot esculenta TaxID=3983 RepID=A0A2C9WHW1_MANES|nr:uncharacterized protein LOC110621525 [Manihot esculenta]OAY59617.1 hypothetical protein MANES_01G045300v8 [Manihot esculenta]